MCRVVIDTNLYIDWLNAGRHEGVLFQRDAIKYLSAVVMLELYAGAFSPRDRRVVRGVVAAFDRTDPTHPAGSLVHALHRAGGWVLAAVLVPLGLVAWRSGRHAGAWLLVLLALQVAVGAALVLNGLPLAAALVHNMLAALLLAVMLALAR